MASDQGCISHPGQAARASAGPSATGERDGIAAATTSTGTAARASAWADHGCGYLARISELVMAAQSLKALIAALVKGDLAALGFQPQGASLVARTLGVVEQGVEFLPPRHGAFSVNLWWRFRLGPNADTVVGFAGTQRLGKLVDPTDRGYAASGSGLGPDFDRFTQTLLGSGMAFLERLRTPTAALAAVESGALSAGQVFGHDTGWMLYNRGLCLLHAGREAEGVADLELLVAEHSLNGHQFHARRMRAEGQEAFAQAAEARFAKLLASGQGWWEEERKQAALTVLAGLGPPR